MDERGDACLVVEIVSWSMGEIAHSNQIAHYTDEIWLIWLLAAFADQLRSIFGRSRRPGRVANYLLARKYSLCIWSLLYGLADPVVENSCMKGQIQLPGCQRGDAKRAHVLMPCFISDDADKPSRSERCCCRCCPPHRTRSRPPSRSSRPSSRRRTIHSYWWA